MPQPCKVCLLEGDKQQSLLAGYDLNANEVEILPSVSKFKIPTAIVDRVVQTRSSLILEDAVNEGEFIDDSDVRTGQIKSILCAPMSQADLDSGILYLENNSFSGAFTTQLWHHLQIITAQAARC